MQETGSKKIFTYKCALVPTQFFEPAEARAMLMETSVLDQEDEVSYIGIPYYDAVLVYAHSSDDVQLPELYFLLKASEKVADYNKILVSYSGTSVSLVVVEDRRMLLCNSFEAGDFTTAQYYIFLAMKKFQLNPEMSTVYFRTPLSPEQKMSLYRYFRSVGQI